MYLKHLIDRDEPRESLESYVLDDEHWAGFPDDERQGVADMNRYMAALTLAVRGGLDGGPGSRLGRNRLEVMTRLEGILLPDDYREVVIMTIIHDACGPHDFDGYLGPDPTRLRNP